jgi:hypothetical protein
MPIPAPIWFVTAFIPMVASQVLRLRQLDPGGWLFWDYAGRLAGLAVLAALAWPVAFRREKLRMPWMQVPLWVLGIVLTIRRGGLPGTRGDGPMSAVRWLLLVGAGVT